MNQRGLPQMGSSCPGGSTNSAVGPRHTAATGPNSPGLSLGPSRRLEVDPLGCLVRAIGDLLVTLCLGKALGDRQPSRYFLFLVACQEAGLLQELERACRSLYLSKPPMLLSGRVR